MTSNRPWMSGETPLPEPGMPCLPATWGHLKMVLNALEIEDAEYVLLGGFAMNLHGHSRQTGDIDILVRVTPENNDKWINALCRMPEGVAEALRGLSNPFEPDNADEVPDEDEQDGVIRIHDAFVVDVMPRACGLTYEELMPYMARAVHDGIEFNMLTGEGMLLTKRGLRPKDINDRQWLLVNFKTVMATLPNPLPEELPSP